MTIEIHNPELEALIRRRMESGGLSFQPIAVRRLVFEDRQTESAGALTEFPHVCAPSIGPSMNSPPAPVGSGSKQQRSA